MEWFAFTIRFAEIGQWSLSDGDEWVFTMEIVWKSDRRAERSQRWMWNSHPLSDVAERRSPSPATHWKHSRFFVASPSPSETTEFSSLHCKHLGFLSRRWATKSKIAERWSPYCKRKFLVAGPNRVARRRHCKHPFNCWCRWVGCRISFLKIIE